MDELQAIAGKHGLALIDDSCEALGARYKGRPLGAQGQDAVFAFYPNKQITTGEGGVVTTHSEETWRLLKSLRNQGRADGGGWLDHARLGFNYRIDDIRAAIGIGQLEKLDRILAGRGRRSRPLHRAARRRRRARASVPRRRRPRALVVRLRRRAARADADREAVIGVLERARDRHRPLPALHPPAELHAGALRLRGRALPGRRGEERADARAAVPRPARRGRPGLRRRHAAAGARS